MKKVLALILALVMIFAPRPKLPLPKLPLPKNPQLKKPSLSVLRCRPTPSSAGTVTAST